jgi:hypothetical protein
MGTTPCGAPPGMASRRHAPQPPRRPSRRPAVAENDGPRTTTATDSGHGNRSRCRSRTTPTRRTTTRCVENAHGRCWRTRFFGTRVAEPVIAEEETTCLRPNATGEMTGSAPWAPNASRHRCASSRAPQSTGITFPAGHVKSRTGGSAATSDVGDTRDGCRASAGRPAAEGRPNLLQRCPAPASANRRTNRGAPVGRATP